MDIHKLLNPFYLHFLIDQLDFRLRKIPVNKILLP